jgi:hypothetical protein
VCTVGCRHIGTHMTRFCIRSANRNNGSRLYLAGLGQLEARDEGGLPFLVARLFRVIVGVGGSEEQRLLQVLEVLDVDQTVGLRLGMGAGA